MQILTDFTEILGLLPGALLNPQAVTGTITTSVLDMNKFEVSTTLAALIGAVTGTGPTLSIQLQESPDQSTWTNLGSAVALTAGSANSLQSQLMLRTHRYLQAVLTAGGTSPSFQLALLVVGMPKQSSSSGGYSRSPSN